MSEDGLADTSRDVTPGGGNKSQYESDLQLLENLFKKVQANYNVDKVKLFKKLIDSIKELVNESNFDVSATGISLQVRAPPPRGMRPR